MEDTYKNESKDWYVLKVASGAEGSIMHQIKLNYEAAGLDRYLEQIDSPSVDIQVGKKVRQKRLYSGYIFIKTVMSDKIKDAIVSVPKVYSFLTTTDNKPQKITEKEYQKMVSKILEMHESSTEGQTFATGDLVKIKSGSFNEFKGTILAVDKEKKLLTLSILVFHRETQVSVAFDDAEKIN